MIKSAINGVIDPGDKIFSMLRLWVDRNHNGISEPEELITLASVGITALSFDAKLENRRDGSGNLFRYKARVFSSPDSSVAPWAYDVILTEALN